jgi:hypothetical protein
MVVLSELDEDTRSVEMDLGIVTGAVKCGGEVASRTPLVDRKPSVVTLGQPPGITERGQLDVDARDRCIGKGERLRIRMLLNEAVDLLRRSSPPVLVEHGLDVESCRGHRELRERRSASSAAVGP